MKFAGSHKTIKGARHWNGWHAALPVRDKLEPRECKVGDAQGLELEEGGAQGGQHGEAQLVSSIQGRQLGNEANEDAEEGLGGEGLPQHVCRPLKVCCDCAQRSPQQGRASPVSCTPQCLFTCVLMRVCAHKPQSGKLAI